MNTAAGDELEVNKLFFDEEIITFLVIQFLQKYHTDHKPEVNSVLMGH